MKRASEESPQTAEECLSLASAAAGASRRAALAQRGLQRVEDDDGLKSLLLRQLYLAHMEEEQFAQALSVAREACEVAVLPDVARQDLARAHLGLGEPDRAVDELRRAVRLAPASRRSFHYWSLGAVLFFEARFGEAAASLERAVRWSTGARALYRGQLALTRLRLGQPVPELRELRDRLREQPCGQGYGRYVLGELSAELGDIGTAKALLEDFLRTTRAGRAALRVGLSAELERASELLLELRRRR